MPYGDKSVTVGQVTAMTVITPIIPEKLETLKQVLHNLQITEDSPIKKISTIHFARWVVIDNGTRLLFTTNFDGGWEQYLRDFVEKAPGGLDAIWSNCVGYPGSLPYEPFREYVYQHELKAELFYAAYPDITVKQALKAERVVGHFNAILDEFS